MPAEGIIPDLPGDLVPPHSDQEKWLKARVATMCHLEHERFPGSQPISFTSAALQRLEREDFWVCEKSDGIRVLFFVCTTGPQDQTVYLIDRHNSYRCVAGFFFPHHANPQMPLRSTLLDGELVLDVDPRTGHQTLRLLCFDCLVIDDEYVMNRPLDKRYGRLQGFFYEPYKKMTREFPQMAASQPFEIKVKPMERAYAIDKIFAVDVPQLQHGHDGLIFTCVQKAYTAGTDENILKWKPPSENSVDFKLVLRFPPGPKGDPDFTAKPIFALHAWAGGEGNRARYEPFDILGVDDDEWEQWKASGEQYDDRIVEVCWDADGERWRKLRWRDDKPNGNHRNVVDKVIMSIADGAEQSTLIERGPTIKAAWKAREAQGPAPGIVTSNGVARHPEIHAAGRSHPFAGSNGLPPLNRRYGPLATSRWSKVAGPIEINGVYR